MENIAFLSHLSPSLTWPFSQATSEKMISSLVQRKNDSHIQEIQIYFFEQSLESQMSWIIRQFMGVNGSLMYKFSKSLYKLFKLYHFGRSLA